MSNERINIYVLKGEPPKESFYCEALLLPNEPDIVQTASYCPEAMGNTYGVTIDGAFRKINLEYLKDVQVKGGTSYKYRLSFLE